MHDWDSRQYLKFENERTQPAIDLANRIKIQNPQRIVDIGCGPGNSTQVLAQKYPNAKILGVDSSPDMIETAKKEHPEIDFMQCDASRDLAMLGGEYDIVFSNACIQWIPEHERLIPNMIALLKKGGVLAVQTPMNYQEPVHKITDQVIASEKWKVDMPVKRVLYNLTQSGYFDLLSQIASSFYLWEIVYYHKMQTHVDILEWYRGTGLRPFFNILPDYKKKAFEQDILSELELAYPVQKSGGILFKFPRLFFVAVQ